MTWGSSIVPERPGGIQSRMDRAEEKAGPLMGQVCCRHIAGMNSGQFPSSTMRE